MTKQVFSKNLQPVRDKKSLALAEIIEDRISTPITRMLIVGSGDGIEAGFLARYFECEAIGIDLGEEFEIDTEQSAPATLLTMDARSMQFEDSTFDFVFSFHALEHIPRPEEALKEMRRVLKKDGHYLIGTPNKNRWLGYFGSPASFAEKVEWNISDINMRLKGRWENELGAHAGFTVKELKALCRNTLGEEPEDVSTNYYIRCYSKGIITPIVSLRLSRIVFPCVYVFG